LTQSAYFSVDTVPPSTTSANAAFSNDSAANGGQNNDLVTVVALQNISGTLTDSLASDETVFVSINNGQTWTAASGVVGSTWHLDHQMLSDSDTLKVVVSDAAGNLGPEFAQTYVIDSTPPDAIVSDVVFSDDSGADARDLITNIANQTISGALSRALAADETVYLSLDGGTTWTVVSDVSGTNWSLGNQTLLHGGNTLLVKVVDLAGNDGEMYSSGYNLDTTAPLDATFEFSNASSSNGTTLTSGTVTPGLANGTTDWRYSTDAGASFAAGSNNSFTLAAGSYAAGAIQIQSIDLAGNMSTASYAAPVLV